MMSGPPMSNAEYEAAAPARRWLERVCRGPFGPLIYYYGAFWVHRMLLPLAPEVRKDWKRHMRDSLFVLGGFFSLWRGSWFSHACLRPENRFGRPLPLPGCFRSRCGIT